MVGKNLDWYCVLQYKVVRKEMTLSLSAKKEASAVQEKEVQGFIFRAADEICY